MGERMQMAAMNCESQHISETFKDLLWNKRTKRCRLRIKIEVIVNHQY